MCRVYKEDIAEIDNIEYDMLNPDVWVKYASDILSKKIDGYDFTESNQAEIKKGIQNALDEAITHVEEIMKKENNCLPVESDNLIERVARKAECWGKTTLGNFALNLEEVRNNITTLFPIFVKELNTPEIKVELKKYLTQKIQEAANKTFSTKTDMSKFEMVLLKYNCDNKQQCQSFLMDKVEKQSSQIIDQSLLVFALFFSVFLITLLGNRGVSIKQSQMILLLLSCIVLLIGGLTTPMIEVKAMISDLSFQLIGEPVTFKDQVFYFQSKSIIDIVSLLVKTNKFDMILIAFLITTFSIIFPLLKIISSLFYYYNINNLRDTLIVRFFALYSGKWAMADVMVVAFFITYFGFKGMISSQLDQLNRLTPHVTILTNDGTKLQVGFFLFLGFCIASMVLSAVIEKQAQPKTPTLYKQ